MERPPVEGSRKLRCRLDSRTLALRELDASPSASTACASNAPSPRSEVAAAVEEVR
jgi:hypothetical protein